MKRVIFRQHGDPTEVIEIIEEDDPTPGPGEVRVRNRVMTINPADLLSIEGRYGSEPITLPATPGVGAYGVVDAVGEGVTRLAVGDAVLPVGGGFWADTLILRERMAPKAPTGADPEQAALMRANPGTAHLMLTDIIDLQQGDWVVQNAANSNVGRMVIRFARERGLHTVNIVRRADVVDALNDDGADAVIVDQGQDIAAAIAEAAGAAPKLALDAVGGGATRALGAALADRGTVVAYGLLSGRPNEMDARDVVFRNVRLRGFWLFDWYRTATFEEMRDLHGFLEAKMAEGILQTDIEARYPLDQIKEAVAHAARGGRNGKILLKGDHNA
ncbi:zinc-dependent alcohol dehydrogenase family protein [Ruegeria pomeroyi]|uniref:enoyl-[acyl-carrier-protein] reductase n=1 Tax=Ruegeria pomeroyi TaxID=89184 RepID=A0A9Q3WNR1_9RHOB|nr:zinc-dependent alcohol dehydrogenase family protein [Ruegeria pomeroyi]MCE8539501.1 zinc-dependent alcohol dehydrogenase family protein [Ruegeria pomeroyi]